ncbi:tRNA 2-thiouridine(34) synthase MnmA [Candidatus Falkowbacteria bacterium]|nr:tRNA 2-thiouridine(34) synthase MnmA [Candidatus Falkowbacteria bacterium]
MSKKKKVIIGMSGGVDSSVAAALLKDQGYELLGIFMHFWTEESPVSNAVTNKCCSVESFNDARRVANKLDFPLYTLNLDEYFKKTVVDSFVSDYACGLTPNPCVNCNKFIKFDAMIKKADELGYDYVATGHYAKIGEKDGMLTLGRPTDREKDQTYFLYTLTADKLKRVLFPLADLTKPEVRQLAEKYGLAVASKAESQEICFVGASGHNTFLKKYINPKPGPIITTDGQVVGEHKGLPLYTIGQRKGVEVGGIGPFYVASFDYTKNILYVTKNGDGPELYRDHLEAVDTVWTGQEPHLPLSCQAVIRYRHKPCEVTVEKQGDAYAVHFQEPQRAITPGQSIVFYQNDIVLGGGIIV